ncbi:MAG: arylesterase [Formivibrio sp.]|nr:arylesterase [Formivibrio sp.]
MRRNLWLGLFFLALLPNAQAREAPVLLIFGDSLSAGYGLPANAAWPSLLQNELARRTPPWQVVNASISGETTAGGLTRLPATLKAHKPRQVILELGANDGLRGLPIADMEKNLAGMIRTIQASGASVHLIGMRMPTNYGADYTGKFAAVYEKLAREYKTGFTPFLLAPIINRPELFQADDMHPTAAAGPLLMQLVLKDLKLK